MCRTSRPSRTKMHTCWARHGLEVPRERASGATRRPRTADAPPPRGGLPLLPQNKFQFAPTNYFSVQGPLPVRGGALCRMPWYITSCHRWYSYFIDTRPRGRLPLVSSAEGRMMRGREGGNLNTFDTKHKHHNHHSLPLPTCIYILPLSLKTLWSRGTIFVGHVESVAGC